jgi:hypothetical protein
MSHDLGDFVRGKKLKNVSVPIGRHLFRINYSCNVEFGSNSSSVARAKPKIDDPPSIIPGYHPK